MLNAHHSPRDGEFFILAYINWVVNGANSSPWNQISTGNIWSYIYRKIKVWPVRSEQNLLWEPTLHICPMSDLNGLPSRSGFVKAAWLRAHSQRSVQVKWTNLYVSACPIQAVVYQNGKHSSTCCNVKMRIVLWNMTSFNKVIYPGRNIFLLFGLFGLPRDLFH